MRSLGAFFAIFFCVVFLNISAFVTQIPPDGAGCARFVGRLTKLVVKCAGRADFANGFPDFIVVGASDTCRTHTCFSDGICSNWTCCYGATCCANRVQRKSTGGTTCTAGIVIVSIRPVFTRWTRFTRCFLSKCN